MGLISNIKKMKNCIRIFSIAIILMGSINAQGQDEAKKKVDTRTVKSPFECTAVIDNSTIVLPKKNALEMVIQHRFGKLNSEQFDLAGLYAPSNIRIGFNYGITSKIMVGFGTTKNKKIQDLNWKWAPLQQTRSGNIPITVVYYGNVEYDARDPEAFGLEYTRSHKVSYFNELLVARKFSKKLSLQASIAYSHYNQIDTTVLKDLKHDNLAFSLSGRYKIFPDMSVLFAYNSNLQGPEEIKPALGLGLEVGTSAHAFQVFLTTADAISRQTIMTSNRNDLANNDFLIGFNITRMWYF
jgi:hypothetical protein